MAALSAVFLPEPARLLLLLLLTIVMLLIILIIIIITMMTIVILIITLACIIVQRQGCRVRTRVWSLFRAILRRKQTKGVVYVMC